MAVDNQDYDRKQESERISCICAVHNIFFSINTIGGTRLLPISVGVATFHANLISVQQCVSIDQDIQTIKQSSYHREAAHGTQYLEERSGAGLNGSNQCGAEVSRR
jgi:hypothetical protein